MLLLTHSAHVCVCVCVCVGKESGVPIQIVYVPSHLYHILFEIFKNAVRAVVEHHGAAARDYPPVSVLVVRGKEDVTIKVYILFHVWKTIYLLPPYPNGQ